MDMKYRSLYAIMGSGGLGVAVAKELYESDVRLIFIELDKSKAETLKEQGYDVVIGDISDPDIISSLDIANLEVAFILSSDSEANLTALKKIKELKPDVYTISKAEDQTIKERLEAAGVDSAILPTRAVANVMVQSVQRATIEKKAKKLQRIIGETNGPLAIIMHNNPDPDAISGAMALKEIAKGVSVKSEILYHGKIGHQENKAFVNLLGIDLKRMDEYDLSAYSSIALIEGAIPGVNNMLPPGTQINIAIDHHPVNLDEVKADFIDIQPDLGASATIMTFYLKELKIKITSELATALLYGIRVDTNEFKKNATESDLNAAAFLYPIVDHEILSQIETPSMSVETLDIMGYAIKNRQVSGSYLISNVGIIRDRDALPQAADYLMNLEGVTTSIIFGLTNEFIYLSARSKDVRVNIGEVLREAFGETYGGGHAASAGAKIPLGVFSGAKDKQTLMKLAEEAVVRRLFDVMGVEEKNE
jgi:nanoRNase/pAp phosphatase (c-di-AMP/oligoRNAs hydrolase)